MIKIGTGILLIFFCASMVFAAQKTGGPQASWSRYKQMIAQGASVDERISFLDALLKKYRRKKAGVQLIQAKVERNYLGSWKFYLKEVNKGAIPYSRLELLDRIKRKYANTGVDLSLVEKEYAALTAPKAPPQPAAPAEPAVSTAPVSVTVSTQAVQAEPLPTVDEESAPLQQETPAAPSLPEMKRTAKYFGVCAKGLGTAGLSGFDGIYNHTDRISIVAGYGTGDLFMKVPNSRSSANQTTYQLLGRYGETVYVASGIQRRVTSGEAVIGSARASGQVTNYAIPFIIGVETGNKRGLFFNFECAYVPYFGDSMQIVTATDPLTGETASLDIKAPESGTWFGFGLGLYFF